MPSLGELLLADGVCTPQQIDDAVQNQVILGGRLGTNLVELGVLSEEVLARTLSRQHELPAMFGENIRPDPEALKLLPHAVADRLEIIPFMQEGKRLQVLCTDPRNVAALDEVAFITNLTPDPVVVPEIRFWELLRRCYGLERALRFVALDTNDFIAHTLVDLPPRSPSVSEDLISEESFDKLYHRRDGFPEVAASPPLPPSQAMPLLSDADLEELADQEPPGPPGRIDRRVWLAAFAGEGRRHEDQLVVYAAGAKSSVPPEAPAEDDSPLTFAEATTLLTEVKGRDAIAHCVLRYARSVFKRAMLFTIHRGLALGWDAVGEGVDRWLFRSVMIPLDEPSVFQLVVGSRSHFLGALNKTKVNIQFLRLMGKQVPLSVILMPILVRERVVNILYGDNGHKSHCGSDIGELLILSRHITQSYESLFQEKRRAYRSSQGPA